MRCSKDRYLRAMVTLCAIGRPWGSSTTPSSNPLPFSRRRMPAATSSSPAAARARVTGISTRGCRSATAGLDHPLDLCHHGRPAVAAQHLPPQTRGPAAQRTASGIGDRDRIAAGGKRPRVTVCDLAEYRDVGANERGPAEPGLEGGKAKALRLAGQQDQVRHAVQLGDGPVIHGMFAVRFCEVADEDYEIIQSQA